MIKLVIFLVIAYIVVHVLASFKKKKSKDKNKNAFKAPSKDKIRDAEFQDSE